MLRNAVREMRLKDAEDAERRRRLLERRQEVRQLDSWLNQIESMLELDRRTVPDALIREIAGFLRNIDPKLQRDLLRNRTRDAARVLDVLFDAQEAVLPGLAETA